MDTPAWADGGYKVSGYTCDTVPYQYCFRDEEGRNKGRVAEHERGCALDQEGVIAWLVALQTYRRPPITLALFAAKDDRVRK